MLLEMFWHHTLHAGIVFFPYKLFILCTDACICSTLVHACPL